MRVVIGETFAGYLYRALLDGEELKGCCIAADEQEGWADCYVLDGDGRLFRDPDNGFEPRIERRRGIVKIIAPAEEQLRSYGLALARRLAARAAGHPEIA